MIQNGLSKRINDTAINEGTYIVKGPMGKGLEISAKGVHIAFTAGTGVLVFLDLVAHLIRKNLGLLTQHEDFQLNLNTFKFILYVAFPNKNEIIGYDLCKSLRRIVKKKKLDNFEYIKRISNIKEKNKRWDSLFIETVLKTHSLNIAKIWVCGPPKMNEDFDKNLLKLKSIYGIEDHQIEIM